MGSELKEIAPIVISLIVIAALALLWRGSKSIWLLVAIVAELAGLVFRAAFSYAPAATRSMPMLFTLWSLSALVFAVGLLGYAIEQSQKVKQ